MKNFKTIYLSATGKHISLAQYLKAWKMCIEFPDEEFKHGLCTWWPQKGKDIRKDFIEGMMDRINTRKPNDLLNLVIVDPNK